MLKPRTTVLREAIADWSNRGLITPDTAETLRTDLGPQRREFSFAAFILIAGVLCIFAAALSFVAANWDDMPRLMRLVVVLGLMWGAWIGGIWAGLRNHPWLSESLLLLGSGMFGVNIMLISQLYHIQGEPIDAVWLWAVGATLAAALTRSHLTLVGATVLWFTWLIYLVFESTYQDPWTILLPYLAPLAILSILAWWTHSRLSAHLLVLSFLAWCFLTLIIGRGSFETLFPIYTAILLALVPLFILANTRSALLRGFENALLAYALGLSLLCGIAAYAVMGENELEQAMVKFLWPLLAVPLIAGWIAPRLGSPHQYDLWVSAAFLAGALLVLADVTTNWVGAIYILALAIWITRMGWRFDLRRLRVIGVLGFIAAMLSVYIRTVADSLMGTSGFFLGAGVVLLASAYGAHLISKTAQGEAS